MKFDHHMRCECGGKIANYRLTKAEARKAYEEGRTTVGVEFRHLAPVCRGFKREHRDHELVQREKYEMRRELEVPRYRERIAPVKFTKAERARLEKMLKEDEVFARMIDVATRKKPPRSRKKARPWEPEDEQTLVRAVAAVMAAERKTRAKKKRRRVLVTAPESNLSSAARGALPKCLPPAAKTAARR